MTQLLVVSSLGTSQVSDQDSCPSHEHLLKGSGLTYDYLPGNEEGVVPHSRSPCGQKPSWSSSQEGLLMAGFTADKEGGDLRLL